MGGERRAAAAALLFLEREEILFFPLGTERERVGSGCDEPTSTCVREREAARVCACVTIRDLASKMRREREREKREREQRLRNDRRWARVVWGTQRLRFSPFPPLLRFAHQDPLDLLARSQAETC